MSVYQFTCTYIMSSLINSLAVVLTIFNSLAPLSKLHNLLLFDSVYFVQLFFHMHSNYIHFSRKQQQKKERHCWKNASFSGYLKRVIIQSNSCQKKKNHFLCLLLSLHAHMISWYRPNIATPPQTNLYMTVSVCTHSLLTLLCHSRSSSLASVE